MLNLGPIPVCCIIIWADAKWLGLANSLPPQPHFPVQGPHLSLVLRLLPGSIFIHISKMMKQHGGSWTVHSGRDLVTYLWSDLFPLCHNGCFRWRL